MADTDRPPVRPFADVIREIRKGVFVDELSIELADLVEAVQTHAKPGTLTITLKVKPANERNTDVLVVADSYSVKKPESEVAPSFFYVADGGALVRNDPNALPFTGPVRPVAPTIPGTTEQESETA